MQRKLCPLWFQKIVHMTHNDWAQIVVILKIPLHILLFFFIIYILVKFLYYISFKGSLIY